MPGATIRRSGYGTEGSAAKLEGDGRWVKAFYVPAAGFAECVKANWAPLPSPSYRALERLVESLRVQNRAFDPAYAAQSDVHAAARTLPLQ